MALQFAPKVGVVVLCDFDTGFKPPEMVKRRLAVVVSPPISVRPGLCTVVPLSTTKPDVVMSYHQPLKLEEPMPERWRSEQHWAKCDMVFAAALFRSE
jgi:mRNA interferase MazF